MNGRAEGGEELIRCSVCDDYIKGREAYTCPKCRRQNICKRHRIAGFRECASCVFESRARETKELKQQQESIRSFLRLAQFAFIVFAVLFIAVRAGLTDMVEFLQDSIITENLVYLGAASVLSYALFFFILRNQNSRVREKEEQMQREKFRMAEK
ncbi:MAG: hypothetical protein M0Z79_03400 [Nitrospiraceae bacterium]|nr:hypothetical protein [Nitrospiraceae bacterium]